MPGPGHYQQTMDKEFYSKINSESIIRPFPSGVSITKDESERCLLNIGENVSPGPARYNVLEAE